MAVLRSSRLGDLLLTTPALRVLRECLPWARITLVTPPALVPAISCPGLVDEVVPFSLRQPMRRWLSRLGVATLPAPLRRQSFDLVFCLSNRSNHKLLAAALDADRVITPDQVLGKRPRPMSVPAPTSFRAEGRGIDRSRLPGFRPGPNDRRHMVVDHIAVIAHALGFEPLQAPDLEIARSDAAVEDLRRRLAVGIASERAPIWIHPGYHRSGRSGQRQSDRRLWPAERWTQLTRDLVRERPVVLTAGSRAEARLTRQIARGLTHCVALERSGLGELAALGEIADLFIGLDSGPMHIAAATGTPMVALFGPSHWEITGPWTRQPARLLRLDLPCSPCKGHDVECPLNQCMQALRVEDVLEHARDLLAPLTKAAGA